MNPVYVSKDGPVEEMRGIAVDIARELAEQLGVAFEPFRYKAVNQLLEGAKAGEWDVAFIGLDPTRTADEVGNTYLVLANSPIQNIGDADRPGHRLAVTQGATQDLFLSKILSKPRLFRVPLIQTSGFELLTSGRAHALAGNTQVLVELAPKIPGAIVVEGSIYRTPQALAVVKGRPAGASYAKEFIEHVK